MSAWLLAGSAVSRAEDFTLESVGARYGFPGNQKSQGFNQAEVFANVDLPAQWVVRTRWHVQPRLDFSAGWLGGHGDNGFIGTAGASLALSFKQCPLKLEGGVGPTLLSRTEYGSKDFGDPLQFTSYGGLYLDLGERWRLGYRYQHMSNAHLSQHNGALNLQMIAVSFRF